MRATTRPRSTETSTYPSTTRRPARCSRPGRPLLVRDAGARRTGEGHELSLLEPDLLTPLGEVAAGEVECVSELDQHIQRHHQPENVLAAGVVDQVLDDDECAAL